MGRRASLGLKPKKRKKVTVQLIREKHAGEVTEPYKILNQIRNRDHGHLEGVKIALAWRLGWRPDANGILSLGKCRKRGDLDRELDTFDFVILLNKEAWNTMNEKHKRALIDHELCHAQVVIDADGNPKTDDRDRLVCRIRKHDIEEFKAVVQRHGCYTQDLVEIAKGAINDAQRPLLAAAESATAASAPGTNGDGQPLKGAAAMAWRSLEVTEVGATEAQAASLNHKGVCNLGELYDVMQRGKTKWYKGRGVGRETAGKLADGFAAFRNKHPEYQFEPPEKVAAVA